MDPSRPANSDVPSKNDENKPGPSRIHSSQPSLEPTSGDQEREYSCKYCTKKFSNKQALAGHQNAHKVERATEKIAQEMHENYFGHFAGGSSYPAMGPYLGFYNSFGFNEFPYHPHQQHGIRIDHNPCPGMPLGGHYPHNPSWPGTEFNNVYTGWGAHGLRIPQFPEQGDYVPNNPGLNVRFATPGAGGSGSGSRLDYPDLSRFREPGIRPGGNPGGDGDRDRNEANNDGNDQQADDDSELDLSLKL